MFFIGWLPKVVLLISYADCGIDGQSCNLCSNRKEAFFAKILLDYRFQFITVLRSTFSGKFLEQLVEMTEVMKAAVVADIGNAHALFG